MDPLIGFLIVLGVIGYLGFHAYVFFCRPQLWAAMQQRKHERELAKSAERRARAGNIVGGITGGVVKALLGGVLKNRHN